MEKEELLLITSELEYQNFTSDEIKIIIYIIDNVDGFMLEYYITRDDNVEVLTRDNNEVDFWKNKNVYQRTIRTSLPSGANSPSP